MGKLKLNNKKAFLLLLIFAIPHTVFAGADVVIRPYLGYGTANATDSTLDGNIQHFGMRLLLTTEESKRYGIEITKFRFDGSDKADDFYATGIVLEQTLWSAFKMSIGALGYFGYGVDKANPFGAVLMLGWEPKNDAMLKPFAVLRNDYIFYTNTNINNSLSVGATFEF